MFNQRDLLLISIISSLSISGSVIYQIFAPIYLQSIIGDSYLNHSTLYICLLLASYGFGNFAGAILYSKLIDRFDKTKVIKLTLIKLVVVNIISCFIDQPRTVFLTAINYGVFSGAYFGLAGYIIDNIDIDKYNEYIIFNISSFALTLLFQIGLFSLLVHFAGHWAIFSFSMTQAFLCSVCLLLNHYVHFPVTQISRIPIPWKDIFKNGLFENRAIILSLISLFLSLFFIFLYCPLHIILHQTTGLLFYNTSYQFYSTAIISGSVFAFQTILFFLLKRDYSIKMIMGMQFIIISLIFIFLPLLISQEHTSGIIALYSFIITLLFSSSVTSIVLLTISINNSITQQYYNKINLLIQFIFHFTRFFSPLLFLAFILKNVEDVTTVIQSNIWFVFTTFSLFTILLINLLPETIQYKVDYRKPKRKNNIAIEEDYIQLQLNQDDVNESSPH